MTGLADPQGQSREAHEWYHEAADRGNVEAMGRLATCCSRYAESTTPNCGGTTALSYGAAQNLTTGSYA
ncbi:hypothetical protein ACFV4K_00390 [Nocardia sp. NPDC059764]|uniref:hypothetical protein n=1 Tax=Nocardia sp. NPDC059764 TaxID=3346939 RepID=UPI00366980AD